MVEVSKQNPIWKGVIDTTHLQDPFKDLSNHLQDGLLEGNHPNQINKKVQFLSVHNSPPPFPQDIVPKAIAVLDLTRIPLWMFADMTWNLYFPSFKLI
jgi:hypothetical protein